MRKAILSITIIILYCAIVHAGIVIEGGQNLGDSKILYQSGNMIVTGSDEIEPANPNSNLILDIPENDNCADAMAIGEVDSLAFDLSMATFDGPGEFITSRNVWYLYTPTESGVAEITTYGSSTDGMIVVYDGDECYSSSNLPSATSLAGGETIETAVAITDPLPVVYTGNLSGYTHDYDLPRDCAPNSSNLTPDVVYSYTSDSDTTINIFLSCNPDERSNGLTLAILDAGGNILECGSDWSHWFNTYIINFQVTAGETYYFLITDEMYSVKDYNIQISSPSFNMITCNNNYYLFRYARVTFDVTAGQQYLVEVGCNGESQWDGIISTRILPSPPANDNCENASDGGILEAGSTIQYTFDDVAGATVDCAEGAYFPEVWISFTLEDTMDVTISYCDLAGVSFLSASSVMYTTCPCDIVGDGIYLEVDSHYCNFNLGAIFGLFKKDLPPGTYLFPIVTFPGLDTYIVSVIGAESQLCSETSLFGQTPGEQGAYPDYYPSDTYSPYLAVDDFSGIYHSINSVTWWGLENPNSEYTGPCDLEVFPFQIIFYEESGFLNDTAAIYEVDVAQELTGHQHFGLREKKFVADINPPLEIEEGWLSIRGNAMDSSCWFWWLTSDIPGRGLFYDGILDEWQQTANWSFCLNHEIVSVDDDTPVIPVDYTLSQNYPNPFNATTSIRFMLQQDDDISLEVYDVAGRIVKTLCEGKYQAGTHDIVWDGTNSAGETVASGLYFYKLECNEGTYSKQMVLLK